MKSLEILFKTTPRGTRSPNPAELQDRFFADQVYALADEPAPTTKHVDGPDLSTFRTVNFNNAIGLCRIVNAGTLNFMNDTKVPL